VSEREKERESEREGEKGGRGTFLYTVYSMDVCALTSINVFVNKTVLQSHVQLTDLRKRSQW